MLIVIPMDITKKSDSIPNSPNRIGFVVSDGIAITSKDDVESVRRAVKSIPGSEGSKIYGLVELASV